MHGVRNLLTRRHDTQQVRYVEAVDMNIHKFYRSNFLLKTPADSTPPDATKLWSGGDNCEQVSERALVRQFARTDHAIIYTINTTDARRTRDDSNTILLQL